MVRLAGRSRGSLGSTGLQQAKNKKGSRTPTDADKTTASADAARAPRTSAVYAPIRLARSPVGVPLRLWLVGCHHTNSASGQASWDVAGARELMDRQPGRRPRAVSRALAAPACPSPVKHLTLRP